MYRIFLGSLWYIGTDRIPLILSVTTGSAPLAETVCTMTSQRHILCDETRHRRASTRGSRGPWALFSPPFSSMSEWWSRERRDKQVYHQSSTSEYIMLFIPISPVLEYLITHYRLTTICHSQDPRITQRTTVGESTTAMTVHPLSGGRCAKHFAI
jgi:hypothetical protein